MPSRRFGSISFVDGTIAPATRAVTAVMLVPRLHENIALDRRVTTIAESRNDMVGLNPAPESLLEADGQSTGSPSLDPAPRDLVFRFGERPLVRQSYTGCVPLPWSGPASSFLTRSDTRSLPTQTLWGDLSGDGQISRSCLPPRHEPSAHLWRMPSRTSLGPPDGHGCRAAHILRRR